MELDLPAPYVARPYRGPKDHPAMASILGEYHRYAGRCDLPSAEQFDVTYANLTNCDTATDIMVIEAGSEPVGYIRTSWEQLDNDARDYVFFSPMRPAHILRPLFEALVAGQESHLRPMAAGVVGARFRAYAPHPGPGTNPANESAWLESLGYEAVRFFASLVRPDLENIPDLPLPDGVEICVVTPEMLLAASLKEIKARGMTDAALGVDTSNPGGAFQLYTKLGFELRAFEAAYAKPLT